MQYSNAKDGMIHDIASFLITVIQAHKKCFIAHILFSYFWYTAQYNLLCSILVSSQSHNITKSLFHNPFKFPQPLFTSTHWMQSSHHFQHCHSSNDVYNFFNQCLVCRPFCPHKKILTSHPHFWVVIWLMPDCYNCLRIQFFWSSFLIPQLQYKSLVVKF